MKKRSEMTPEQISHIRDYDRLYSKSHKQQKHEYYKRNSIAVIARVNARRQANPEKAREYARNNIKRQYRLYPQRFRARSEVYRAIQKGILTREPCQRCGLDNLRLIHAHHHNGYEPAHWLDVIWLCRACHHKVHG